MLELPAKLAVAAARSDAESDDHGLSTQTHQNTSAADGHAASGEGHGDEAAHGGEHEGGHTPELENIWNLLAKSPLNKEGVVTHHVIKHFDPYVEDQSAATRHKMNQNVFFSIFSVLLIWWILWAGMRKRALIPGRFQGSVEFVISGLSQFFLSILGEKHGRRYLPFLVALFLFVLVNNWMGLVPLFKSSTAFFQCNIMLGLTVFLYVQYTGLRHNGPKRYVLHLLGNPKGPIMWCMSPLLLVLEIIGELVKPISLSLRLFGNIMGEDILLGVFAMLGIALTAVLLQPVGVENVWVGIPLHFPFMFLAILTSTIQALIFSLLSCVYILLMLPHDEGEH